MPSQASSRIALAHRVGGPVLVVAAFVFILLWTWRGWNDPLIDYGQTLYVAWRLSEGDVLYRDIAYMFGPLSAAINGVVFRIAGPGLMHLVVLNVAIAALVIIELGVLLRAAAGRVSAVVGCLVFIFMFCFAQYTLLGNYNFITPYTPEITHGLALSLLVLCLLWWHARRPRQWLMVAAGVCWGAVFLTKPEVFFAITCAAAVHFALAPLVLASGRAALESLGQFLIGAIVIPMAFLFLFKAQMPWMDALRAVAGAWIGVFNDKLTGLPFYRRSMGIDDVGANLWAMGRWTLWLAAVFAVPLVVAIATPKRVTGRVQSLVSVAMCIGTFCVMMLIWKPAWLDSARALTATTVISLVIAIVFMIRRVRERALDPRAALRFTFIVFAMALLAKALLRARLYQYGFVIALPAMMVLVAAMMDWIPAWIERRGGAGRIARFTFIGLLAAVAFQSVRVTTALHDLKRHQVGESADAFAADERGRILWQAAQWLDEALPPDGTLLVLPEGVMLNYLARRINPSPYLSFLPSDFAAFDEQQMLQSLRTAPPDCIAIVHRDTSELGPRFFGRDYGLDFAKWIVDEYEPVITIGHQPMTDERFGVQILARLRRDEP